jgi:hypothetical protein
MGGIIANIAGIDKDSEIPRRAESSYALVIPSAARNLLCGKKKRQPEGCLVAGTLDLYCAAARLTTAQALSRVSLLEGSNCSCHVFTIGIPPCVLDST